jgi:integrase
MTLDALFEIYRSKQLRFKSDNTVRLYRHTLKSFSLTLGRTPTIHDLDSDIIELHMERIIRKGGSPASANKDRGQLLALWRFAAAKRIVEQWPTIAMMKEPEIVPMGWLADEAQSLLKACNAAPGYVATVPAKLWWAGVVSVLLDTGERIGAIRPLKKHHLQGGYLLVPAVFRKGQRRDRLYSLQPETVELLKKVCGSNREDDQMFPWDRSDTYIYRRYNAILKAAGLPTDRRSKFHRLRRTVASAVTAAGGDATAALDHASPKTTKKYLDPRIVGTVSVSKILAAYLATPGTRDTPPTNEKKATG